MARLYRDFCGYSAPWPPIPATHIAGLLLPALRRSSDLLLHESRPDRKPGSRLFPRQPTGDEGGIREPLYGGEQRADGGVHVVEVEARDVVTRLVIALVQAVTGDCL